ncbi:unnamed protein product [Danaus chrysippus]|uniref:(African queen) hypothetical protein n=1 Tax=Danaus chrysippus TaxID=151541 RepID=A0A8J2QPK0_9NEOP|nr:unnamed protein product [Danaus chrysippus]
MKRSRGSEQSARNNGYESNNRFIERDALSRQLRGVAGGDRVPSPTVTPGPGPGDVTRQGRGGARRAPRQCRARRQSSRTPPAACRLLPALRPFLRTTHPPTPSHPTPPLQGVDLSFVNEERGNLGAHRALQRGPCKSRVTVTSAHAVLVPLQ